MSGSRAFEQLGDARARQAAKAPRSPGACACRLHTVGCAHTFSLFSTTIMVQVQVVSVSKYQPIASVLHCTYRSRHTAGTVRHARSAIIRVSSVVAWS